MQVMPAFNVVPFLRRKQVGNGRHGAHKDDLLAGKNHRVLFLEKERQVHHISLQGRKPLFRVGFADALNI